MISHALSGRDYYAEIYAQQVDAEAKWLAFGAVEKANSVERLLARHDIRPRSILELGAGTGAIISELQRRGIAERYTAVDYSPEACDYLRKHVPNVDVLCADITLDSIELRDHARLSGTFPAKPFKADVVIVSHVLEHLEHPHMLLEAINRNIRFKWLVIECPLEDLPASRFKNRFRNRLNNLAGHVQFYTPRTLRETVARHFDIIDQRHYIGWAPPSVVRFLAEKDRMSTSKRMIKHITLGLLPRFTAPIWKRVWLGNYAMLCRA